MKGKLLYQNRLEREEDIKDFLLEGEANISFADGSMVMKNRLDASSGQKANYVLWCPEVFDDNIVIEWEFQPMSVPSIPATFERATGFIWWPKAPTPSRKPRRRLNSTVSPSSRRMMRSAS